MRYILPLVLALPTAIVVHFTFPWQAAATVLNLPYVEEVVGEAVSEATPCSPNQFRVYVAVASGTRRYDIECNEPLRRKISGNKKLTLLLERSDSLVDDRRYRVWSASIDGEPVVRQPTSSASDRQPLRDSGTLSLTNFFAVFFGVFGVLLLGFRTYDSQKSRSAVANET